LLDPALTVHVGSFYVYTMISMLKLAIELKKSQVYIFYKYYIDIYPNIQFRGIFNLICRDLGYRVWISISRITSDQCL